MEMKIIDADGHILDNGFYHARADSSNQKTSLSLLISPFNLPRSSLQPSLDGKEFTAFKAVVLSSLLT